MAGIIIAIIIGVSVAVIQWKQEKGQPTKNKGGGLGCFLTLVTLPICLLDSLFKWARKK